MVTKFQQETLKSRFAQAKVLVVGDVMLDRYWFGDVSRISPEAPVPVAKNRPYRPTGGRGGERCAQYRLIGR